MGKGVQWFSCVALSGAALLAGCGGGEGPVLDAIAPADRLYLFSQTDRGVAFLGQPAPGVTLSCDPQAMQQGYVFRYSAASKRVWLDSLRPSGTVSHTVRDITAVDGGYEVGATNGAGVNFRLVIETDGAEQARISWDGAEATDYLRCPMM